MNRMAYALALSVVLLAGCPPASPPAPAPSASTAAPAPAEGKVPAAEWCAEHGVPEAVCTRCNARLVDGFKAKKDWCAEHGLPESQCVACDPQVEAKWKAMAPDPAPR